MTKPLILVTNDSNQSRMDGSSRRIELPKYYANAVAEAGGVPLMSMEHSIPELTALFQGLVLSGGDDLPPALYGETPIGAPLCLDPVRTDFELPLAWAFLEAGKPVLAVCRGMQLVNVLLGGSLWQDLPAQLGLEHGDGELRHALRCEEKSLLRSLFGETFFVNSTHHQAVKEPAPGLIVTARAADGVIEAMEHEARPLWCVQFHPERLSGSAREAGCPDFLPLFQHFIHSCGEAFQ